MAALQMFGFASKTDFAALGPWDISPERQPDGRLSADKAQEMIATAVREGSHFFEWQSRRMNGESFTTDILLTRMLVDGQVLLQCTVRDISERKNSEAAMALASRRTAALLDLPLAVERMSEVEFMQHGLEQAEQLTGSQIAFIHFVNDDQQTIELVTWSRATLEHYCHAAFDNHYPISQAGIWADALRQRMPVVFNDYANAAGKHGLPDGHARLERLISVPVIDGGLVRMIAGVGNKLETYSDHDVETVRLVANTVWRIVRQRRADAALKASEARYRAVDQSANDAMVTIDITGNIVGHNPATARLFGYDEAGFPDRH
ncbi:MAG: GAF domain-containing protein [Betaproteobacteria bacterium]|nr:GAF domain-containing protein [Betaproteobacteria bacterium]